MATTVPADSRRMYSWWWDSHISPKNSKWLQENLSDMDEKIKQMIKLIEEDADSFARRAEMYYMKRPDLLKLVEEFYRAYRALAERYDHATGVLRQAHRSMAEAFPDQVPLDSPILPAASSEYEDTFGDSKDFDNDFVGHLLRKELVKLEAEKEASLLQMCGMEKDIEIAREENQRLTQELMMVEEEKEDVMRRYEMSLETISSLEQKLADVENSIREVTERSDVAEIEVEIVKHALEKITEEKESASLKCSQLSTKVVEIWSLVEKTRVESKEFNRKKQEIVGLRSCAQEEQLNSVEVETALQNLQNLLFQSQEEMRVLKSCNRDLQEHVKKADEENKNLKELNSSSSSLIDSLRGETVGLRKIVRNLEKEIEIQVTEQNALHQEINLFKEKLDMLKGKYQLVMEQVQSVGLDPERVRSYVKNMQDENSKLREFCSLKLRETASLFEKNDRLEISVSDLNSELEEVKQKLQEEQSKMREFFDQKLKENETLLGKNALLEISVSGLNSELEEVKQMLQDEKLKLSKFSDENTRKNADLLERNALLENSVSSLNSELEEAKQNLQDEIVKLRECCDENMRKNAALLEKSAPLENSVSYLNKELEEVQQKLKATEESRASLISQLQVANMNSEWLERRSDDTQNSLSDANAEVERLKITLKRSEDSWLLLLNEKLALITERESLSYQLDLTKRMLEDSVLRCKDLERKCFSFKREREENAICAELSKTRVAALESRVLLLQQEALSRNREFKDELDKALNSHLEMFILKNCMQDLEDKNSSLTFECQKLVDSCKSSERRRLLTEKCMSQKVHEQQDFLSAIMDENFRLLVEKSVLSVVIDEMQLEAMKIAMERDTIYKDLKVESENYVLSLNMLHVEAAEAKLREQNLFCDLQKERHEVELWEAQATDFFCKMIISNFHGALLEETVHEFTQSKIKESELLGKRVRFLEEENVRLTSMFGVHASAEVSFKNWAAPLKNFVFVQESLRVDNEECSSNQECLRGDSEETQDIKLITHLQSVTSPIDEDAQHAERRILPENSSSCAKSEDGTRKLEGLRSKRHNSHLGNDPKTRLVSRRKEVMKHTNRPGKKPAAQHLIHPKSEVLTKDIVLDQMSNCSTFRNTRRENDIGSDERMLELWETTDLSGSIDLTVGISRKAVHPSRESFSGKELGVDKVEVSEKSSTEPHQGGKNLRRLLERLNTDAQKLTNLQITVQDLKRKVEITERCGMGRAAEYRVVREQLEEAEVAVLNFFDVNHKLTRSIQKIFLSRSSGTDTNDGDHISGVRRRISEQARRGSEKIANLQLEVQKIQLVLVKLDDEVEKESRGNLKTARVPERKPRILLKDFLHVRVRTNLKRKKGQFCACVQLPNRAK